MQQVTTHNGLITFQQVELLGVVTSIKQRNNYNDPTEFRVNCPKLSKYFDVYYEKNIMLREQDIIYCYCQVAPDGTLVVIRPPFVQQPVDRNNILQCMIKALRVGFRDVAYLYRKVERLAEGEHNVVKFLSDMAQQWSETKNLEILYLFRHDDEDQIKKLLEWWHKERNLRRLYLFGLSKKEINASRMTAQELYDRCIENPYTIPSIGIDKCDSIFESQNKKLDNDERERGAIVRIIWKNLHESAWTGTPSRFLVKQFPNIGKHMDILKTKYGVEADFCTAYLKFPHKVETFVSEYFVNMVKRDKITYDTPLDTPIFLDDGTKIIRYSATVTREMSEDQMKAIQGALDHTVCIIKGGPGVGKCLDPNEKILMFSGDIKVIKDIKCGELIMGPDSKPRKVLSTCSGVDNMFEIKPELGKSFVCNAPHVLTLKGILPYIVQSDGGYTVFYSERGIVINKEFTRKEYAEEYKKNLNEDIFDIPLDEYLELDENIKNNCYLFHCSVDFPHCNVNLDPYQVGAAAIKLGHKIPRNYKINSKEIRQKVLEGILDHIKSEQIVVDSGLIDDVEYILQSLGYLVDRKGFELKISIDNCKRFEVIPLGKGNYCGFELDGDGRFLLGDFVVTHNTSCLAQIVHNLELRGVTYAVCSFTGKAVSRIKEVTKKRNPATMHKLISNTRKNFLDKRSTKFELEIPLMDYEYVIIDEVSMVTTELFYDFITAYPNIQHLVLIGDVNQLPPIGWGNLYYQLLKSETIPTYCLTTNYRVYIAEGERDGIVFNCNAMVAHDPEFPFEFIETSNFSIIEGPIERVYEIVKSCHSCGIKQDQLVILSPYNRWLDLLNKEFQAIFDVGARHKVDNRGIKWMIGDKVMLTENNQEIGVSNGETGTIKDLTDEAVLVDFGDAGCHEFLFEPTYEARLNYDNGTTNRYYKRGLPIDEVLDGDEGDIDSERTVKKLVHAYAMTIDKSQGSEWDFVILFIPEFNTGSFINKNRILTGISRGKRCCWCVVADSYLFNVSGVKPPPFRCDNLSKRLEKSLPKLKPFTIIKPFVPPNDMLDDLPILPKEYEIEDGYGFDYDSDDDE